MSVWWDEAVVVGGGVCRWWFGEGEWGAPQGRECDSQAMLAKTGVQAHRRRGPRKYSINRRRSMTFVSAIKLIRTDTTLDLSQKAEKGMHNQTCCTTTPRCPSQRRRHPAYGHLCLCPAHWRTPTPSSVQLICITSLCLKNAKEEKRLAAPKALGWERAQAHPRPTGKFRAPVVYEDAIGDTKGQCGHPGAAAPACA